MLKGNWKWKWFCQNPPPPIWVVQFWLNFANKCKKEKVIDGKNQIETRKNHPIQCFPPVLAKFLPCQPNIIQNNFLDFWMDICFNIFLCIHLFDHSPAVVVTCTKGKRRGAGGNLCWVSNYQLTPLCNSFSWRRTPTVTTPTPTPLFPPSTPLQ